MNKVNEKVKYILYARKSTESEDRQVLSISSQIDELKIIAERENIQIVDIMSESKSAKTLGRPVFAKLIDRISKGEANGILCWKLDRLARNFIDGGKIIEMIQHGVIKHIQSFSQSYYPQDNVLLMSLEFGMANQYSRDLSVNVTRGLKRKAEMGWYPVQPPIGYLNSKNKGRGNNDIYKDPERFDLVRKMWDLMLTGTHTMTDIWKIARNDWQFYGRRGIKISQTAVFYMFTNPFYYGMFEWPRKSGNWYTGSHEPMITTEEYDRVQVLLGRKGAPRKKTHEFAFTGIMKCGECGAAITAEEKSKRQQNGNRHDYIYYHCTHRVKKNCSQKTIEEKKLTNQINGKLQALNVSDEFHVWAMKWLKEENAKEAENRNAIVSTQQKTYADTMRRLDRYIEMRANKELTEEEFLEKKASVLKEKTRMLELINDTDHRVNTWADNMENAFKFITRAELKLKIGTPEERKLIFSALGSNFLLEHRKLLLDMDEMLLPVEKLAGEVQAIHARLEPRKKAMKQKDFEQIYSQNSVVCAQQGSNLRPYP